MSNAIVTGSLRAISQATNKSIAESFVNADCIVIVDVSGSMGCMDSRGGQSRYAVACNELADLQKNLPGKIAVLAFSDSCMFCPDGQPFNMGAGTNLAGALKFARVADVSGMRFIVISDGWPDSPAEALQVAKSFKNRIDTIYVGPEGMGDGREFLNQLAAAHGGLSVTADRAKELSASAQRLLLSA